MKIFTIGGSGMIGSRVTDILGHKYSFDDLSREGGVDIAKAETLDVLRSDQEHDLAILFAAKADVDGCEADRELKEEGDAYKINVTGVQNVVDVCKRSNTKLIYISTDFVFDGTEVPENGYAEGDEPNPVNWYGETKYLGELIVKSADLDTTIVRIAYPYRKEFEPKKDFVRAIVDRLKNSQPVSAVTDHKFSPTFIDDIAHGLDRLIEKEETGIFHVTGSASLSPYEAALLIAEKFGLDRNLISETTRAEFFTNRAPRPYNLSMNNDKIKKLGVKMRSFEEGLSEMRG